MEKRIKVQYSIPQIITGSRIVLTFFSFYVYILGFIYLYITIFIFAAITDIVDGIIARKLDVCSKLGSYFDVTADFILIFIAFLFFIIDGIYPVWLLFLIGYIHLIYFVFKI